VKSFFVITQENAPPVHVWSNNDYGHQRFGVSQVILLLLLKKIFESTLLSNRECRTTFSFRIERSQLRCVRHKTRMPRRLARRVLLATPSGKHPRGQPRTSLCDYISNIAWFRLDEETAELSEIPENREIFQDPLGLLSPRSYKMRVRKVSHALLWWNKTILTKQWVNSVITYSWAKLLILLKEVQFSFVHTGLLVCGRPSPLACALAQVVRRPWAPSAFLEFAIETGCVLDPLKI